MDWLQFFASLARTLASLAWPAIIISAIFIFRKDIRSLLPRMRVKHKDTELSFRLHEAERVVESLPPPPPQSPSAPPEELSNFERIARVSPRAAILEMRREIEDILKLKAKENGLGWITSSRQILRFLRKKEVIDGTSGSLLDEVLAVGNIAAHDSSASFTVEDAIRYRGIVDHALRMIDVPPPTENDYN